MTIASLLTLAALAAGDPAPAELRVVDHPFAPGEVPAGSRDDQLLWTRARDGIAGAMDWIGQANQARFELRYARLNLDELERSGAPAEAEPLRALRARLEPAAAALDAALPRGPLGGCRYTLLYFEQSMSAPKGTDAADKLEERRRAIAQCAAETEAAVKPLAPAVKQMRATLDEVAPEIRKRMAAHRAANPLPAAATPPAGPAKR